VLLLFALLHDTCRFDDWEDPEHGPRASVLTCQLADEGLLPLDERQREVLLTAIRDHTGGLHPEHESIGACWDADRLTLFRVGETPLPKYLSTDVAPDLIDVVWDSVRRNDMTWAEIHAAYAERKFARWRGKKPAKPKPSNKRNNGSSDLTRLLDVEADLHEDLVPYVVEDGGPLGSSLHHPLLIDIMYTPKLNAVLNKMYEQKLAAIAEAERDGNWHRYVFMHERPYRLDAFEDAIEEMDDSKYWDLLSDIWIDSENIWQNESTWVELLQSDRSGREEMMSDDERARFDALPDTFTVHRGFAYDGRDRALSWSLSETRAEWFAGRFAKDDNEPRVATGTVSKADALAFLGARNEDEIIILPGDVRNITIRVL
jgi:hypothetical protein